MTTWCMRLLLAVAAVFSLVGHGPAIADQGVSINLGSIRVDEALERGGSYRLPVMEVTNPGTEVSVYRMTARPVTGQDELPLTGDWFVMTPEEFTLEPGATRSVTIMLMVPLDAEAGVYGGLLGPSFVPVTEGASVGAGVAAKVTFEVLPDGTSWTSQAASFIDDSGIWLYGALGLLLILVLVSTLRRRFTFHVERR